MSWNISKNEVGNLISIMPDNDPGATEERKHINDLSCSCQPDTRLINARFLIVHKLFDTEKNDEIQFSF